MSDHNPYTDYRRARREAQADANRFGRDMGIEKATEYGKTVYRVKFLPRADRRFGWELRCEVVTPEN
jgi:hypothetical protein